MSYSEAEYLNWNFRPFDLLMALSAKPHLYHLLFHFFLGTKITYLSPWTGYFELSKFHSPRLVFWAVGHWVTCCKSYSLFPCGFLRHEVQNCTQVSGELWDLCRLQRQHRFWETLLLFDWVDLAAFCHSRNGKSHWAKNHFPEGLSRVPLLQMFPHWQVHFEMSHWIHI